MGRGFLAGIFWGGLIGLFLLVVSNQVMDRRELSFPQPTAAPVEVPAGTEFDQARPETDPVVPDAETRPGGEVVAGVQAPDTLGETPPSFDTSALEIPTPTIESPDTLGDAPVEASEPEVGGGTDSAIADDSPSLTAPDAPTTSPDATTQAPGASDAPEVADTTNVTAPEAETSPQVEVSENTSEPSAVETPEGSPTIASGDATSPQAPSPTVAPEAPTPGVAASSSGVALPGSDDTEIALADPMDNTSVFTKPVELQTDRAPAAQANRLPRVTLDGSDAASEEAPAAEPEPEPEPEVQTAQNDTAVETPRVLPTVRRLGQSSDEEAEEEQDTPPATADAPVELTGRALTDWRMEFENPGDRPLVSIVLVHDGSAAITEVLRATPDTVAIGIDASASDAPSVAQSYRDAGREIVLIPSLPAGAAPQDVEVTLQANFEVVSQAVAVMDPSGEGFQADREAVAQVVDAIASTGHGLITFPRGLNTALQQAERSNVPAGLVFRDLAANNETVDQVQRALDRAAFRARDDEAIILVGRTSGDTLVALTGWVIGTRAQTVTLAPVSAALDGS